MDDHDKIYRDLRRHLDRQPVGFPATKSGAEIRILKRIFSPEEARLALHLTYKPAPLGRIRDLAAKDGLPGEKVAEMLDNMVQSGGILRTEKDGIKHYQSVPFVLGMYEYQLKRLTPEFLDDIREYFSDRSFGLSLIGTERPQMRTVPVNRSISAEHHVATYDDVVEMVTGSEGPFAVTECICRKTTAMSGKPCGVTSREETCMPIGIWANHAVETGMGRYISREEALDIVRISEEEGLVFQPSNAQKVDFICACCGCCCGMLRTQKMLPRPVDFWATNYEAAVDPEACTGCGVCADRCQVGALTVDGGAAIVDLKRCIGCGNCVVTCPAGALSLVGKKRETVPPPDSEALYDEIMAHKKGPLGKAMLIARLMMKR